MRSAVDVLVRRIQDLFRHLERHRLAGFQSNLYRLSRWVPGLDHVHGVRHRVVDRYHQLAETPTHAGSDRFVAVNICNRTAVDQLAVLRIMIGGSERFHDRHTEPAMGPGRRAEGVVMPEHGAHIHIHPPPIADKLRRYQVARRVIVLQRLMEGHLITLDLFNPNDFLTALVPWQRGRRVVPLLQTIHADHDFGVDMEGRGTWSHLDLERLGSRLYRTLKLRHHRRRQPMLGLLPPHGERPHRHLILKP